jgi:homoserine O-acetyltransferase
LVIDMIRSDPQWEGGNYTRPPIGWLEGFEVLRMMIDGVPHLQAVVPDQDAAEKFLAQARQQSAGVDANDILYSLEASADYNPEPGLSSIKTKVVALNFSDDEFNPDELHILENLMPELKNGRYVVQPGTSTSFGHLTMAHPELWADHVAEFMHWLGDTPTTGASAD